MTTIRIDDPSDPRLSDYRGLTDTALRRIAEPEGGLYIAESAKVISRAVGAGHRPRSVLVQEKWIDDVAVLAGDAPVYVVPDTVAEQVTGFAVHRGALAAMHRPVQPDPAQLLEHSRTVVVLEDIVDHTNVGAAFRAAAALGADAVLVSPRCGDPLYRRSVRVSMGTVFQVPWARLPEWDAATPLFAAAGVHLAAMALADDALSLDEFAAARPDKLAILMGSEGEGLSASALAVSDSIVTIPMAGGVDSLNVASAAAVALWALR